MADEETRKSIIAKRGGHKAYATKTMNDAKQLVAGVYSTHRVKLMTYLKILRERKDVIMLLNEILGMLNPNEYEEEIMIIR